MPTRTAKMERVETRWAGAVWQLTVAPLEPHTCADGTVVWADGTCTRTYGLEDAARRAATRWLDQGRLT